MKTKEEDKIKACKFLKNKIGYFNSNHPIDSNLDYEDVLNWLIEYAKEYHENEMMKLPNNITIARESFKRRTTDSHYNNESFFDGAKWMRDLILNKKD